MSFLGGVDLGTPAERNERVIRSELELRRTREPHSGWGKVYRTGADLLLQHGQFYPGRDVPEGYAQHKGTVGACYWNAARAAAADPNLRYCEGITSAGAGRFLSHGWCLDPSGAVLDFTWYDITGQLSRQTRMPIPPPEAWGYFGVVLAPELVLDHDYEMPLLGRDMVNEVGKGAREEDGHWYTASGLEITPPDALPLLDVPYDPNRTSL